MNSTGKGRTYTGGSALKKFGNYDPDVCEGGKPDSRGKKRQESLARKSMRRI